MRELTLKYLYVTQDTKCLWMKIIRLYVYGSRGFMDNIMLKLYKNYTPI